MEKAEPVGAHKFKII